VYEEFLSSKHPNLEHQPFQVAVGLGGKNGTVGLVRPEALKKIQGNLAADEGKVSSIEEDFKNGEGLYEPVMVFYDPNTGFAFVAEGNHRVQAAINAGEEFIPTIVVTGEVSPKKKKDFTPGKLEKTPGFSYKPEGDENATTEVNPYFIFPDSDILSPEEDSPGLDQDAPELDSPGRVVGQSIAPELIQIGDVVEVKNVPISGMQTKTRRVIITHKSRGAYMVSDPDAISFIGTTISPKASNAYPNSKWYTFRLLKERPSWLKTRPENDILDEPSEEETPWEFDKRSLPDKNGESITEGDKVKIVGSELIYTAVRIAYINYGMVQIERDGKKRRVSPNRLLRVDAPSVEPKLRSIPRGGEGTITEGDLVYRDFNYSIPYRVERIEDDGTVRLYSGRMGTLNSTSARLLSAKLSDDEIRAEQAKARRIKNGLPAETDAPGLDQDAKTEAPEDAAGLRDSIQGSEVQNKKLASMAKILKSKGRFPVPRQSWNDTKGTTSDVSVAAKADYKQVYDASPELQEKYKSPEELWDRVLNWAVDTDDSSPNDLSQIPEEMRLINREYAKHFLGIEEDGLITVYRNAVNNKDSEVDAAAGYVSTDRDFAYDYNSKSGNDGADGRYEIDVKPDEVFGMLGYSKPEDEYAFVIGKGVTSQEGRVRRVGDIASLPTTAPWLEEYTKNISYNRGGTPYRHHALAGQFDFHEVEDFGKNLEEFFGKYNLTSADIKSKFDELYGNGAYDEYKASGKDVTFNTIRNMFIDLPSGNIGMDITRIPGGSPGNLDMSMYGGNEGTPENFKNDRTDNTLKMLSVFQELTGKPFFTHRSREYDSPGLEQNSATMDRISSILSKYRENIVPAVKSGDPGSKETPLELSEEEYSSKGVEVSEANKKASKDVWGKLKSYISPTNFIAWKRSFIRDSSRPLPINPVSETHYRGPNFIALDRAATENGFSDPRWFSASQVDAQGGFIKSGARGTQILVPTTVQATVNGKPKELFQFKKVTVFNGDQISGIDPYNSEDKQSYTAKEAADILLDRMREAAEIRGDVIPQISGVQLAEGDKPRWAPNYQSIERIRLPLRENFKSDEAWFQTLAHELIHSTGKSTRLNRKDVSDAIRSDEEAKAREEITAELGSMILARMFGVGIDEKNSAAYIRSYMAKKDVTDKEALDALTRAQVAVDYVLGNDVLPPWDPEKTKRPPTEQSVRMSTSTPKESSLNPDVDVESFGGYLEQDAKKPYNPKGGVSSSKEAKERVLSSLLEKIKEGKTPWRQPFSDDANYAGAFIPRNPSSKHVYSGINSIVLKTSQILSGYEDPRWMTYNQAKDMGGQVRKGEKGTLILVPMKRVNKEKDSVTGEERVIGSYISFSAKTVFNVAQIDGLDLPTIEQEAGEPKTPLEAQEFILGRYKISMESKGLKTPEVEYTYVGEYGSHSSSPNWRSSTDVITLPTKEQFTSSEDMFDTIAHELAHSTGHPSRLDRSELTKDYSTNKASRGKEELIAEISAAILASMFGVNSDFDNTAAYVQSWLGALKDNPEMVVSASSEAQKVVDYLLGMDIGDWSPIEGYTTAVKSKSDGENDE
jgi:antirestriction protein ArdC